MNDRDFWTEVYILMLKTGKDSHEAERAATSAVKARNKSAPVKTEEGRTN